MPPPAFMVTVVWSSEMSSPVGTDSNDRYGARPTPAARYGVVPLIRGRLYSRLTDAVRSLGASRQPVSLSTLICCVNGKVIAAPTREDGYDPKEANGVTSTGPADRLSVDCAEIGRAHV